GDVTDVIADAVFLQILIDLSLAGEAFGDFEGLPDRAGVGATPTDVVNFTLSRVLDELFDEAGHVVGMDVVTHLLAFVAKNLVFPAFEVAFDEVGEEAMQLHPTVVGSGQASATQTAGGHAEIAAIF